MIPKVIHYCWFGGNPLPKSAQKCIDSWRKFCPDYDIIEWNENNFDVSLNQYVREAYQNKKFAFVSDYVRLYAMYTYGGIYMDTDVEVVKNLDDFLHHEGFSGFESDVSIPTGIMASQKGFKLFEDLLAYYDTHTFINSDGSFNMTTNVATITSMMYKYGFVPNGKFQIIEGFALYPKDYFCPLENGTGKLTKTSNTATIHWFNKSWVSPKDRLRSKITKPFHRIFGNDCFKWLKK